MNMIPQIPCSPYRFYRERLSGSDLKEYDAITDALLKRAKSVRISSVQTVRKLFKMVMSDLTYLYHIPFSYALSCTAFYPTYLYGEDETNRILAEIDRKAEYIHGWIQPEKTVFGKVKIIHDVLCLNIKYDTSDETNHLAGALIRHRSACLGISLAFKYLCDREGIPSAVIWSDGTEGKAGHAWNLVQLENQNWYGVDVTSDLGSLWGSSLCRHDYFLVSTVGLGEGHTPACSEVMPVICDFDLYRKVNRLAYSDRDVERILAGSGNMPSSFKTAGSYLPTPERIVALASPYVKSDTVQMSHNPKSRVWYINTSGAG